MASERDIEDLRSQVDTDARSPAFVRLARALNARGEHEEAARVAQRGLLAHPDAVEGRLALAVAEAARGRVREALEQIKRALLIDQENPEALGLMGRILLERGLTQRAAQFLAHAVKLAPERREYRKLLQAARAEGAPAPARGPSSPGPRVFGPEDVPDADHPWREDDPEAPAEPTVFAPDAGQPARRARDSLDDRLAALPSVRDEVEEEEPTRLATAAAVKRPAQIGREDEPAEEEPTRSHRRGKVGGSAAELSRVLQADEAEQARLQAEKRMGREAHLEEEPTAALSPDLLRAALEGQRPGRDEEGAGRRAASAAESAIAEAPGSEARPPEPSPEAATDRPGPSPAETEARSGASAGSPGGARREGATAEGAGAPAAPRRDATGAEPASTAPAADAESAEASRRAGEASAAPARGADAATAKPPARETTSGGGASLETERASSKRASKETAAREAGAERRADSGEEAPANASTPRARKEASAKKAASSGANASADEEASSSAEEPGPKGASSEAAPQRAASSSAKPASSGEKARASGDASASVEAEAAAPAEKAAPAPVEAEAPAESAASSSGKRAPGKKAAAASAQKAGPAPAKAGASAKKAASEPAPGSAPAPPSKGENAGKEGGPTAKGFGPVATRMVDDALFAILGQRPDAQPSPAPDAQVRPRVVRTSERIGAGARILGLLVLAAAGFGVGLAAAVAPDQAAPEVAAEELKGVASDLERGGLAALRKAEETIAELDRSNPELRPVLAGALAEIHARRFARFGRAPSAREAAREAARAARAGPATVESLYAAALTSTAPAALERLDRGFAAALDVYPESPKAWVGRALVSLRRGEEEAALARLLEARALHPQHRQTLLETARWLARRGASRAALETYARLQSYHGLDVEAAIERFVLDWATGQDPAPDEAVSILAGLVREEIAEVAGDEAGRAALAFALPKLRNARVQEGLTELSKAEGAFAGSPDYQSTVGRVLLALGEAERAQESFLRAAESAPEAARHALDLARARFAEAAGYRFELEELRKRVARLQRDAPLGQVRLPYGTVEARPATFTLVSVELDAGAFPESLLAAALEGDAPRDAALAAAVDGALARRALREGDLERARSRLQAAREHADLPLLAGIEGRLLLARGRPEAAAARLGPPVEAGRGGPVLALALARARAEAEDAIGALDAYARFFARGGLSPEARVEEARLRMTRGDDEGALEALDAAEALESGHAAAALTRAEVLLRQERPEDARAALERAIELEPRIARGIPPRGLDGFSPALLTELGARALPRKRRLGIALLRAALEEPGAPAKVHFHLGAALVKRRATRREGRRELARYLSLAPEGPHRAEAERLSRRR